MGRCTRYILRQLIAALGFVTVALTGVVWLSQSLRFVDLIVNKGLSVASFLLLTLLLLPTFLGLILPIALFCAVVFVYNRLVAERELMILRSAGLGPAALARPVLALALAVAAVGYAITLYFMPASYRTFKDQQFVVRTDLTGVLLQEGAFNDFAAGLTVYVRAIADDGGILGILVHDERAPERPVTMMAEHGALMTADGVPRLVLVNGNRQQIAADGRNLSLLYFDRYVLDLAQFVEPPQSRWREPRERFLHELIGPPAREEDTTYRDELLAEAHARLVAPWSGLALGLIALAALTAGEFSRRGGIVRVLAGTAGALAFLGPALVLERAMIDEPRLVPLYYAAHALAPLAAWIVLHRHRWPAWRRPAPA
ncbi:MAG: LPS export ABC transporter permease LptF [Alphaproteobacteria bacterium]|nr:LPS export ABC transporter permease LptF [Alphaproteobacteria bacterium]